MTDHKELIERLQKLRKVGFGYDLSFDDRDALLEAENALEAAQEQVVEVKPLEWEGEFSQTAETPFCIYGVTEVDDGHWAFTRSAYPYHEESEPIYSDENEAKAAAQEDYERLASDLFTARPASEVYAEATAAAYMATCEMIVERALHYYSKPGEAQSSVRTFASAVSGFGDCLDGHMIAAAIRAGGDA